MKYRTKTELKKASPDEIARTAGVSAEIAREVYELIQGMK